MTESFKPSRRYLSLLGSVGGVVTVAAAIASLKLLPHDPSKNSLSPKPLTHTKVFPLPSLTQITKADSKLEKRMKRRDATGLTFEIKSFYSNAMGERREYGLVLPPGYNKDTHKSYPVVFLLHGGHGDATRWQTYGEVTSVLAKLYQAGQFPPTIVITPDGNDKRGSSKYWDPQYFDGPNGRVGTLIGSELVQEVKSRYRVLKQPQFWAIGGLSSGGWGAFNIGLHYLDNFNILFSHSGYFTDTSGPENSPTRLVQKLPLEQRQRLRVYLDAGIEDKKYLDATKRFDRELESVSISHEFYAFPGGHGILGEDSGWRYWRKHLSDSLTYVGEQWKFALAQHEYAHKQTPKEIIIKG
jgi:enterochelin esterase-like enzyme